ncbi:carotenoid biosynthesis protein [Cyclobacterium marinum]|uniref:carotenoid biosynthesis protein n=1 Tax=Cyclobacterium marinum TaxID=104 RepID=UPI0030DB9237|tara:strand:- start:8941 stop:9603 length:663 start_codon:yes stop_codon:yes gene_type:complete
MPKNINSFLSLKPEKTLIAKIFITILHIVGLLGLYWEQSRPLFQLITPFHLIVVTGILLYFHRDFSRNFIGFLSFAFMVGMSTEIIGVNTGLLFGDYSYSSVMGIRIFGVPLTIGLNWFLLVYLTGGIFQNMIKNDLIAAVLASILMVILDLNLEIVAVELNFWQWHQESIPLSNYVTWFLVAFIIQMVYRKASFEKENPLHLTLFFNLLFFFAILAILL